MKHKTTHDVLNFTGQGLAEAEIQAQQANMFDFIGSKFLTP
jgi:hypothetical protein